MKMREAVGITTTVPVEIIFAAGLRPIDLNNIFITSDDPVSLIRYAEEEGFSHNICSWIRGIYGASMKFGIERIIAVYGGDCSNTIALAEVLEYKGKKVIPFEYPHDRSKKRLESEIKKLMDEFSVSWDEVYRIKKRLDSIRKKLKEIDRLTYRENLVSGFENHIYLVQSSDFKGDPDLFEKEIESFLDEVKKREPFKEDVRLGYIGVPPIFSGMYEFIEELGARVVFNEVQRQFSMPYEKEDLIEQYLLYTYPYGINPRIEDIKEAIKERKIDGIIHYTQNFCFRQIYDIIIKESLKVPVLSIEGDSPGQIDSRIKLRIEAFVEMLRSKKDV